MSAAEWARVCPRVPQSSAPARESAWAKSRTTRVIKAAPRQAILPTLRSKERALEKRQRPDLDALAWPRVGRRGRILERGVGRPAGAAVLRGIEHLEHQRLVAPHARQPIPAVLRIVGDGVGLADAVGVA